MLENQTPLNEDLAKALYTLAREFENQIRFDRMTQINRWKKLDYFWHSIQYLLETSGDFGFSSPDFNPDDFDEEVGYTKVYNIFKAHGESIIAALSVDFPGIIFPPDDAENPDDLAASEGRTKIAELIRKHNRAKLLLIKALFTLYTNGVCFGLCYPKFDKKFGTIPVPEVKMKDEETCPSCGSGMVDTVCPTCQFEGSPITQKVPKVVGTRLEPKSRTMLEVYGPLNVAIRNWITDKSHIDILRLSEDWHELRAKSEFPDFADKIIPAEDLDVWERWARKPFDSMSTSTNGYVVVKKYWFDKIAYSGIKDEDLRAQLESEYPDGVRLTTVGEYPVALDAEDWSDVWAISFDPRSRHIHADPIGQPLVPIQEVTNELFNLSLQTVEQGIAQTFADADVLDFEQYQKSEVAPGQMFPVKTRAGKSISESFFTTKTATLSQEVKELADRLEQAGQFVVGSFPSIYGGSIDGSRTAAEYQMSRAQALQRLSTTWVVVSYFWCDFTDKAVNMFIQNMKTDERFTKKTDNKFETVWIRKTELTGNVGQAEPEIVEQFPISAPQKRDFLMRLFELKLPEVNEVLFHPANRAVVSRYVGFEEFYLPGQNDQTKQYEEIENLLNGMPSEGPNGETIPSVPTQPEIDDTQVHIQVCKAFLLSPRGRMLAVEKPQGIANVLAHLKMHQMDLLGQIALPHEGSAPGEIPKTATTTTGA